MESLHVLADGNLHIWLKSSSQRCRLHCTCALLGPLVRVDLITLEGV